MDLTKNIKAFTLIELLVGITLITIIALATNNLNFNRLNSKQELEIFINNIKSNFETIRNSSLSGKGIGINLDIPDKWKIEYSTSNNGTIINSTFNGSRFTQNISPIFRPGFSISKISCLKLNGNDNLDDMTTGTGEIEFVGSSMTLGGNCTSPSMILELTIKYKTDSKILLINTLNGLSEIK